MDRQTIIGFLLILSVFYVWQVQRSREVGVVAAPGEVTISVPEVPLTDPEPVFDAPPSEALPVRDVVYESCGVRATFSTEGGALRDLRLPDHPGHADAQAVWQWALAGFPRPWKPWGEDPGSEQLAGMSASVLSASAGADDAALPRVEVVSEAPDRLELRGITEDGIEIRRVIASEGSDPCVVTAEFTWTNRASVPYSGGLWVGVHDALDPDASYYSNVLRTYAMTDDSVEMYTSLDGLVEAHDPREGPVQWFGLADRYFAALVLPEPSSTGRLRFTARTGADDQPIFGEHFRIEAPLAAGAAHTERFRVFIGPKDMAIMGQVDDDLPALVNYEYGWFAAVSVPLLWLLKFLHGYVGNWGLAIIALTVTVKGVFFPLTQMSFKSSQGMQSLQPLLAKVREEHKDNPEELNRLTIELFREHGVNPVGGCLPMLVQMPVWFALYRVLLNSVELYHTEFLYLKDLSEVDPYCILPAIVVVLMVIQQRFTPMGNMDPAQARIMKLMPLIFGLFFFVFPSGLVLYIFVNMLLTIAQQWLIRRQFQTAETPVVATT